MSTAHVQRQSSSAAQRADAHDTSPASVFAMWSQTTTADAPRKSSTSGKAEGERAGHT